MGKQPKKNNRYLVYQIYTFSYIQDITLAKKKKNVLTMS